MTVSSGRSIDHLTARQRDVMALVYQGLSNKEIAAKLAISPRTVKKHLEAVYAVLDVNSRTSALRRLAESEGLPVP